MLGTSAVTPAQQITPDEQREAQQLGDHFIQRLRETRDLRPLLSEFFVSDVKKSGLVDPFWGRSVNLNVPPGANLTDREVWDYYAAKFTVDYLSLLNLASKVSLDSLAKLRPEDFDELTPQRVRDYTKTLNLPKREPPPKEQVEIIFTVKDRLRALYQQELKEHPPEETGAFRKNLLSFTKHLQDKNNLWGRPSTITGDPPYERYIRMEIPFDVGLILVKENGHLKIWFAATIIPD
jgi:hypothetical protein